ncbi:MatE family transporter [Drepanopeziza brunnea f. sp. 'multigermtubi' MB_m1]|uniref:MatE family transporter n=1 Tax=Marssonina brunnea f. sp. multigermtubi (strain MB_m1) TaxID=1072389 RepID=K1WH33_MARBU|nr:MatE family transporter [Drepanopeziza brunnea f. sp. 'multigermtubi' MB_m1]EKD16895.1 MatE family transporter [Drepanopeziza brunnea f. sp. 'multigermtubi' MB_m1]
MDNSSDPKPYWLPNFFRSEQSTFLIPPHERTSLLEPTHANPNTSPSALGEASDVDEDESTFKQWVTEFFMLLRGSVPVILAYTLQNSLQTISILIVGRLSPEKLATAAFSYMFAMCTAWLIALGGTTALDTLASSTFTGSKNPHDLGILLQRAFVVLTAFYIPVAVLWACSAPIFRLLGQEEYLCVDSARFLTVLIPGGLGYVYFEAMKKYLQAQQIMRPGTYVLLLTSPLNAGLNYLCVYTFKMGLLGAPFATGIAYWISFFLLVAYSRFVAGSVCWGGWSLACLHNIKTFARLAILGVVHVGTEWWAFEIVALAAGRLGTIPLAAQSIIMTTDQVMNTVPFGIGVAASARVGNLLGSRNAKGAARAANVAAFLSIVMGALILIILMSVKDSFAKIFNDDVAVIKLTAQVLPYVALFQIADGLNGSCGGSLRGMGRQHIGAAVNIASYYMGALPLGIWLAFHGWGLSGLWVGQCIALYLVGAIEWIIVAWSDWEWQVEKAFERMDSGDRVETGEGESLAEGQANGEFR